ncbi:MAG: porin, partial [Pseudomonadota bacterium]
GEGGIMTGGAAIANAGVQGVTPGSSTNNTTAIITDGDAEGITYVAPTFYGLTVGGSYKANVVQEDNRGLQDLDGLTAGEVFGVGALYANTFGGVGFKLSAGWATYDVATAGATAVATGDSTVNEYSFGTQLSYAGFTLGGSYRDVNGFKQTTTALQDTYDANAWDVGVQYATGPYAVSLAYFHSEAAGNTAVTGEDKITFYQASGKYALGPGVDVLASVGYAKFDDETQKTATDTNHNDGWTVMTGMALSF